MKKTIESYPSLHNRNYDKIPIIAKLLVKHGVIISKKNIGNYRLWGKITGQLTPNAAYNKKIDYISFIISDCISKECELIANRIEKKYCDALIKHTSKLRLHELDKPVQKKIVEKKQPKK